MTQIFSLMYRTLIVFLKARGRKKIDMAYLANSMASQIVKMQMDY